MSIARHSSAPPASVRGAGEAIRIEADAHLADRDWIRGSLAAGAVAAATLLVSGGMNPLTILGLTLGGLILNVLLYLVWFRPRMGHLVFMPAALRIETRRRVLSLPFADILSARHSTWTGYHWILRVRGRRRPVVLWSNGFDTAAWDRISALLEGRPPEVPAADRR